MRSRAQFVQEHEAERTAAAERRLVHDGAADRVAAAVQELPGDVEVFPDDVCPYGPEPRMDGVVQVDAEVVRVGGRVDRADGRPVDGERERVRPSAPRLGGLQHVQRVQTVAEHQGRLDLDVVLPGREVGQVHEPARRQVERLETGDPPSVGVQDLAFDAAGAADDDRGLLREGEGEPVDVSQGVDEASADAAERDGLRIAPAGGVGDGSGEQDVRAGGLVVAGDLDVVGARGQRVPDRKIADPVGKVAVVVLVDHGAVALQELADGVEVAVGVDEEAGRSGEHDLEVVGVGARIDRPAHLGARGQVRGVGERAAMLGGGAGGGGGPGGGAGGDRPDLHVVAGGVGQAVEHMDPRPAGPDRLLDSPVGVHRLVGAGLDVAQVIGRDRRLGRVGRLAPRDRQRAVADDDGVDGWSADQGRACGGAGPVAGALGVDRPHLHVVRDVAVQPTDRVLQRARRDPELDGPVGFHRLVGVGLDVAQVIGGDRRAALIARGPCHGKRSVTRGDRGDRRGARCLRAGLAADGQQAHQHSQHYRQQPLRGSWRRH